MILAGLAHALFAAPAPAQFDCRREVRLTEGVVQSAGWEKSLISRTPNLRHWTWVPITSWPQKRGLVGPALPERAQAASPPAQAKPRYIKPIHVPTRVTRPVAISPYPSQVWTEARARSAREEVYGVLNATRLPVAAPVCGGRLSGGQSGLKADFSCRDTSGILSVRRSEPALGSRQTSARLQAEGGLAAGAGVLRPLVPPCESDVFGRLATGEVEGTLAGRSVYGTLYGGFLRGRLTAPRTVQEVSGRLKG